MDELQEQLKKMTEDYSKLMAIAEKDISENIDKVKEGCTKSQFDFIETSLDNARKGTLDVTSFLDKIKTF